jgi:hypothetical protein
MNEQWCKVVILEEKIVLLPADDGPLLMMRLSDARSCGHGSFGADRSKPKDFAGQLNAQRRPRASTVSERSDNAATALSAVATRILVSWVRRFGLGLLRTGWAHEVRNS